MPKRIFKYSKSEGGVVEVTPEESRAFCEEIAQDAATRSEPIECGLPVNNPAWRNVSGRWPVHSDSMACDSAKQVKQEQKILAEHGVQTDYDSEHRPIWRDRAHKRAHQTALGWGDGDAGYGDATPSSVPSGSRRPAHVKPLEQIYAERRAKMEEINRTIARMCG